MVLMFLGAPLPLVMAYCDSNHSSAVLSEYCAVDEVGAMAECYCKLEPIYQISEGPLTCASAVRATPCVHSQPFQPLVSTIVPSATAVRRSYQDILQKLTLKQELSGLVNDIDQTIRHEPDKLFCAVLSKCCLCRHGAWVRSKQHTNRPAFIFLRRFRPGLPLHLCSEVRELRRQARVIDPADGVLACDF